MRKKTTAAVVADFMKSISVRYIGLHLGVPTFNLLEPLPDHPTGSSVTERTINEAGYFIPYPVEEIVAARHAHEMLVANQPTVNVWSVVTNGEQFGLSINNQAPYMFATEAHCRELAAGYNEEERLKAGIWRKIESKRCTCGEPHISDRIEHRYDGTPCRVREEVGGVPV